MATFAELSDQELVHRVYKAERDLVSARFKHSMNQLENTSVLRQIRREIATLRTETRRRERDNELPKDSLLQQHGASFGGVAGGESAAPAEKGGFLSGIVDKLTGKD